MPSNASSSRSMPGSPASSAPPHAFGDSRTPGPVPGSPGGPGPGSPGGPGSPEAAVTHAPYRREPYVRCRTPSSSIIDGKAAAWTRTSVLLHWIDDAGRAHNRWVPAGAVHRIARDDSTWQDPYDDWSFYYPDSSPARLAAAA
ncbi:hypothetical protein OL239_02390 [Arthrobacter sp. ATA002]|uniref:hypothetical protein n=1 Tax=Arthrobacter sp. ATA002 TaxID=2991715 RepID=UPI0022A6C4BC|nr:hypothetical protein [Arthrobacter sp. ATA002]WAP52176.1 hypothetical protein OL239_02390 [Arthrobacter sp. ATA002]